uniref:Alpha-1,4 glucan phosphorylase n=2 Tax=Triticinae TaxID=1648030 RepID=A0A077RXF1_WHEAT|nr:unnamed protein product [Triticum aestivum]
MSAADKVKPAASPASEDPSAIAGNISYHAQYSPHFSPLAFGPEQAFYATAESVRDHLLQRWNDTYLHFHKTDPKQTYYLSMEYLQGRALTNAVGNLAITGAYADALKKFGYELEAIAGQERDAALGNGGLGRLASCFLDSMATLNLPSWGYGLRYRYGLFKQRIAKEGQEEIAEDWLDKFSPWEIVRHDVVYPIRFFGHVEISPDGKRKWAGGEVLNALAYDVPIPGYKTKNAISLRLWDATATAEDFNLFQFNDGQYESAAQLHSRAQQICAVLYPGDATEEGKLLRLKQQYFLCSASLQFADDEKLHAEWAAAKLASKKRLAKHVLDVTGVTIDPNSLFDIQIKRIHEYKRQLLNILGAVYRYKKLKEMSAEERKKVTPRTVMVGGKAFATYTNAKRIVKLVNDVGAVVNNDADVNQYLKAVMRKLLPRHMEIIEEIDKRFREMVISTRKDMEGKIESMRVLDNNPQKPVVRMANLCVVAGHTVNGVAELHSNILKQELFADYVSIWPNKFQNKTNGITPRRWLRFCNPELSEIVTKWLKTDQWTSNLDLLTGLRKFADDEKLHAEWAAAKLASKKRLAKHVLDVTGVTIDPNSLFDIQIKRIHEYKRQLLNILGAVYRYKKLKEMSAEERKKVTPRTVMVGGKAFATYTNAKRIVKLVNDVGAVVNNDADVNQYLKVVFIPNYNVSVAEVLIPGSELSQHISTAGMEASGTSNMKFSLNGCVIIGTLDGANVEIREEVGQDNFFLFGAKADQIAGLRKEREDGLFKPDPRFEEAKQFIRSGAFGTYDYTPLLDSLEGNTGFGRGDYFLVGYDFPSYIDAQARVDEAYKDKKKWIKMSILNTAGSGKFSSDRTIDQYAKEIWGISACPVP